MILATVVKIFFIVSLGMVSPGIAPENDLTRNGRLTSMETPPDPEKAVATEYERLRAKGTRAALELFIARHPAHPLANKAREEIRAMPAPGD